MKNNVCFPGGYVIILILIFSLEFWLVFLNVLECNDPRPTCAAAGCALAFHMGCMEESTDSSMMQCNAMQCNAAQRPGAKQGSLFLATAPGMTMTPQDDDDN